MKVNLISSSEELKLNKQKAQGKNRLKKKKAKINQTESRKTIELLNKNANYFLKLIEWSI